MEKIRIWVLKLDKALEKLGDLDPESIESVNFEINQKSSENDNVKKEDNERQNNMKDWEYPELNDNMEDFEDDGNHDIPDYTYHTTRFDSICEPYMDTANRWVQSLLDNVNKKKAWMSSESEVINSKNFSR